MLEVIFLAVPVVRLPDGRVELEQLRARAVADERHRDLDIALGHVQIAAVPNRAEPDEGEIAFRAIFDELDRLGYEGWVGCEYKPRGDTDAGLTWVEALDVRL